MKKEINQEIRMKIIQLIHKKLNEIGGKNIFKSTVDFQKKPIHSSYKLVKYNVNESEKKSYKQLFFNLMFEDGEPNIRVDSIFKSTERKKPYKKVWTWRGKKMLFTTYSEHIVLTFVRCGHIDFSLTEEESQDLIDRTELAWNKYLSLKDIELYNQVLDKINLRLNEN